jgi:type II secretory pathway component GspD/PulD (secretin)
MMDIHPEVSTGVIDPVTGIPSQATTEVTTRMIVPDGQTIFVGGLIKHRTEESKRGVPILGRVPGIGRLFSNRENVTTDTETIVLITPTILTSDAQMVDEDTIEIIDQFEKRQASDADVLHEEMQLFFK